MSLYENAAPSQRHGSAPLVGQLPAGPEVSLTTAQFEAGHPLHHVDFIRPSAVSWPGHGPPAGMELASGND